MRRLERYPRRTFHFTPTSASWPNAVEGFFAGLAGRRLKHGVFCSVVDLQAAINRFIKQHTETEAKPFTRRADPDQIIAPPEIEGSKCWKQFTSRDVPPLAPALRLLPSRQTQSHLEAQSMSHQRRRHY